MPASFFSPALSRHERNLLIESLGTSSAVAVTSADGRLLSTNAMFDDLFGYEAGRLVGKPLSVLDTPGTEDAAAASARQVRSELLNGAASYALRSMTGKNGSARRVATRYYPLLSSSNSLNRIVHIFTDVTQNVLEQASRSAFVAAIENSQAVIEFECDGTIVGVNDTFCAAMGYRRDELVGKQHWMFIDQNTMTRDEYEAFWASLRSGKHKSGEFNRRKADGSTIWLSATYAPVHDEEGRVRRVVKVAADNTDLVERRIRFETVGKVVEERLAEIVSSVEVANERASAASAASSGTAEAVEEAAEAIGEFEQHSAQIAASMSQSRTAVSHAATETQAADKHIGELSSAAESMSSIVELIQKIAGQINLLALNATIESARAGEAGRGFAVVAAEVKSLADQVEKSTNQIAGDIARVQSVSANVVAGLRGIGDAVQSVEGSVNAAVGTVEQQSAAARELVHKMNDAAGSMRDIDRNLNTISDAVASAQHAAHDGARLYKTLNGPSTEAAPFATPQHTRPLSQGNALH